MSKLYADICRELGRVYDVEEQFDDLRLVIHPDALESLISQMGSNTSLLDQSRGRPTHLGQLPIIESPSQSGWALRTVQPEATQ